MKQLILICLTALSFSVNSMSQKPDIDIGDYSLFQTLWNLQFPKNANAKVTEYDKERMLPLNLNDTSNSEYNPKTYGLWQTIELASETGASCLDGSTYKFQVLRRARTSNIAFVFQGGGFCWNKQGCRTAKTLLTPFTHFDQALEEIIRRVNPFSFPANPSFILPEHRIKTQDWNIVYLPYCSQDLFIGNSVIDDNENEKRHYKGLQNATSVVTWVKNNWQKPGQMLITGSSAGGFGAILNYMSFRELLQPQKSYLLNDSGVITNITSQALEDNYNDPIKNNLKIFNPDKVFTYFENNSESFERKNLSSIYKVLSEKYPDDRLALSAFKNDAIVSTMYLLNDHEINRLPNQEDRIKIRNKLYKKNIEEHLIPILDNLDNFGYYFPSYRNLINSHTLNTIDFQNNNIEESNIRYKDFIDNILIETGSMMKEQEMDYYDEDLTRPIYGVPAMLNVPFDIANNLLGFNLISIFELYGDN